MLLTEGNLRKIIREEIITHQKNKLRSVIAEMALLQASDSILGGLAKGAFRLLVFAPSQHLVLEAAQRYPRVPARVNAPEGSNGMG